MDAALPVTLADIERAAAAIAGAVEVTPARDSRTLSTLTGADIVLKFENLQFTASFKERGALNKLLSLNAEQRRRGVIAMSAGNHAQGVAYHAQRLGIPATIVMPEGTSFTKVKHTRDFGARVVIKGATLSEARGCAQAIGAEHGLTLVHPYDDPQVIAGQGTVALEFLSQVERLDALVVPVGGGGLISGVAIAARALKPDIRIYGVQSRMYPSMYNAVKGENLPIAGQSIADGISVKEPGGLTTPIVAALVCDLILVAENETEAAMARLLEIEKILVEGAGAVGLAAVLARPELFKGRRTGLIHSGGNVDMRLLSNVILRELAREGRILSLVITIEDRPGLLARIATLVGDAGGNILDVSHNRLLTGVSAKSADLGMVVEARDARHAQEIKACLDAAGYLVREHNCDPSLTEL
jgi:threonine dehydratase